jgi:hypothetical protein
MVVGEIKKGNEIGRGVGTKAGYGKYIWLQCGICKKERWVTMYLYKKNGETPCQSCSGRKHGKINAKKWGRG